MTSTILGVDACLGLWQNTTQFGGGVVHMPVADCAAAGRQKEDCPANSRIGGRRLVSWLTGGRRDRTCARRSATLGGASGGPTHESGVVVTATMATVVHGLFGVAVVAMLPWKSVVIRRSAGLRVASVLLLVIIVGCLLAGFVQLFVGYLVVAGITPIQVHVGAAVITVPLLIWHVLRHRRQRLRPSDLSRRALVQDVVLAAGVAAVWGGATAVALRTRPDRPRAPTGSRPAVPGPVAAVVLPATTWLFDTVPELDPSTHHVTVAGGTLTVAELVARAQPVTARLDCTIGWYADASWDAVRLSNLIGAATLDGAVTLRVRSITGYERAFPAVEAQQLWF